MFGMLLTARAAPESRQTVRSAARPNPDIVSDIAADLQMLNAGDARWCAQAAAELLNMRLGSVCSIPDENIMLQHGKP